MANETILIVDADITSQKVLEVSFKKAGHRVLITDSIVAAHEHIARELPGLIIVETELPDGDGLEFCADLKLNEETKDIPLIFLTEDQSVTQKMRSYELGADDYLTKPVYIKEVITRADLLLQRRAKEMLVRGGVEVFEGDLEEITTIDLLQRVQEEERSGSVRLFHQGRQGAFFFRQGKILDGVCGKLEGEDAIYRMMLWSSGEFVIRYDEAIRRAAQIEKEPSELLIEGISRMERWTELKQGLPGFEQVLAADYEGKAALLSALPPEVERIVRLFDGYRRLDEVVADSPIDDLKTLQIVQKLLDEDLLLEVSGAESSALEEASGSAPSLDDWLASEGDFRETDEHEAAPEGRFSLGELPPDEEDTEEMIRSAPASPGAAEGEGGGHWKVHWGDSEPISDEEDEKEELSELSEDELERRLKEMEQLAESSAQARRDGLRELEEQERLRREEEARRLAAQREMSDREQEAQEAAQRERTITPIFTPARALGETGLEEITAPGLGEVKGAEEVMQASGDEVFGTEDEEGQVGALDQTDEWILFTDEEEAADEAEAEVADEEEAAEGEELLADEDGEDDGEDEAQDEASAADDEESVDTAEFDLDELYPAMDPEYLEGTDEYPQPEPMMIEVKRNAVDNQVVLAEFQLGKPSAAVVKRADEEEEASGEVEEEGDEEVEGLTREDEAEEQEESPEPQVEGEDDESAEEEVGDDEEEEALVGAMPEEAVQEEEEEEEPAPIFDEYFEEDLGVGSNSWRGWVIFAAFAALFAVILALVSLRGGEGPKEVEPEPAAVATTSQSEEAPEEPALELEEEPLAEVEEEEGLDKQGAGFEAQFEGASVELMARNIAVEILNAHPELAKEVEESAQKEDAEEPAEVVEVEVVEREESSAEEPPAVAQEETPTEPVARPAAEPAAEQETRTVAQDIQYVRTLIDRDRIDEALEAARRLTERAPNNSQAAFLRGQAALNSEQYSEALEQLTRAESAGLRSGDLYLELGTVYQVLGRSEDARRAYETFLEIEPAGRTADDVRTILERQF